MKGTVIHLVSEARGGICRHVAWLTGELTQARVATAVAGPRGSLEQMKLMGLPQQVPRFVLPHPRFGPAAIPGTALTLRAFTGDLPRPHLVHAHGYKAAVMTALCGFRPFVATAHNMPPLGSGPVIGAALRQAHTVIAVSTAVADALVDLGVPPQKLLVIPNGIAVPQASPEILEREEDSAIAVFRLAQQANLLTEWPERLFESARVIGWPRPFPVILGVGRLSLEKGFDLLIDAVPKITDRYPSAALAIVGNGPELSRLEEQAAQVAEGRVRFLGQRRDPQELMRVADLVVIPSRAEGQSLVALESLAAGVRVVASDVGGLPGMIRPGKTGWLFPAGNVDALAETIIQALEARPDQYTASGRAMLEREFNPSRLFRRILSMYSALGGVRSGADSQSNN